MPETSKPHFPQRQAIKPLRAPRMGTVTDSWIYELTNRTGGGEPGPPYVPPPAPPVVIDSATVTEGYDYTFTIEVNYHKHATATAANYKAAAVYIEDPDLSEKPNAPMDGSVLLDGSTVLSGKWNPTRYADSTKSPASIVVDAQPNDRYIRIMLVAFNSTANPVPVRNTEPSPSPSIRVLVPAATAKYQSGLEYAWRVTNVSVDVIPDFDNVAGAKYQLRYHYDEPTSTTLPPGMLEFGGVQIVFEYADHTQARAQYLQRNRPETWISDRYDIYGTTDFDVYFASADIKEQANSVVHGWTPKAHVHVDYPPAGQGSTPDVGTFRLVNNYYSFAFDGTQTALADVSWTNPDSNRYSGVRFFHAGKQIGSDYLGAYSTATLAVNDFPNPAQDWTIYAIAFDDKNTLADNPAAPTHSPSITWRVGPPAVGLSGQEYGSAAIDITTTPATVTHEQEQGSDGVVRMRHVIQGWINPTDPKFGGVTIARTVGTSLSTAVYWDAQKNETKLTTTWEPATTVKDGVGSNDPKFKFWFVFRDMTNHRNSIAIGLTPSIDSVFTPMVGNIIPSRVPGSWWNPAEFEWPAGPTGAFQALQFVAKKIYVGSVLRVGGGTTVGSTDPSFKGFENGQIAVYNSNNKLRAWFGQQGTDPNAIYGGWVKELYVGGSGPVYAPLKADKDGVLIVGGFDVQNDPEASTGKTYPYISVRTSTGAEWGRIGAKLNTGCGPTDSWGQPTPDIGGAWFYELAVGGQTFPDWRILASGGSLKFRNINAFTIDYAENAAGNNAAQRFVVGKDLLFGNIAGARSYAGMKMVRLTGTMGAGTGGETDHWALVLNRGFLASAPGPTSNKMRAFLGTFNGDNTGGDTDPFWGELVLYNTGGTGTVRLTSQDANTGANYARLWMTDTSGNITIDITAANGYVSAKSGYMIGSSLVIDNLRTITAGPIWGSQYGVGSNAVINTFGTFIGAGVSCQSNNVGGRLLAVWVGPLPPAGGGGWSYGLNDGAGASAAPITRSFTTADGKTVIVVGGLITSIS